MTRDEALGFLRDELEFLEGANIANPVWLKEFKEAIAALSPPCACGDQPLPSDVYWLYEDEDALHLYKTEQPRSPRVHVLLVDADEEGQA